MMQLNTGGFRRPAILIAGIRAMIQHINGTFSTGAKLGWSPLYLPLPVLGLVIRLFTGRPQTRHGSDSGAVPGVSACG